MDSNSAYMKSDQDSPQFKQLISPEKNDAFPPGMYINPIPLDERRKDLTIHITPKNFEMGEYQPGQNYENSTTLDSSTPLSEMDKRKRNAFSNSLRKDSRDSVGSGNFQNKPYSGISTPQSINSGNVTPYAINKMVDSF